MTLRGDAHPDELISASLTGDLTEEERATLDAHLAGCEQCRATLEAFSRERNLLGELRRSAPPADLGARIRAGVESGRGLVPWWRRPSTLVGTVATLGTVAAALLAVVILGSIPRGPVGATGSPSASPPLDSMAPSASIAIASEAPTASSDPTIAPLPSADPNPVGVMEYRLRDQVGSVAVRIDATSQPVGVERLGTPINSTLAPGGDWVAFQLLGDGSGLVDTYAYRISDGTLVTLFSGAADSPFSRLAWSSDGRLLAFTGVSADGQSADAWVFSTEQPDAGARQLTDTGRSFAASFSGCCVDNEAWLWVSTAAAGQPTTDRLALSLDGSIGDPVDPAAASRQHVDGAFLPVVGVGSTSQPMAVAWRGEMALDSGGWHFARGGMLYAYAASVEGAIDLAGTDQPVFDTLAIANGGEAFRSARFAWAPDGDGLAVWDAQWQGIPQPAGFPDASRVYFGHPLDGVYIGPAQALDAADTAGGSVIDVSLAGGQYLALTIQTAEGSEAGAYGPSAEVRIVTRNTGDVPDDVSVLADDGAWIGPAFYRHSLTAN